MGALVVAAQERAPEVDEWTAAEPLHPNSRGAASRGPYADPTADASWGDGYPDEAPPREEEPRSGFRFKFGAGPSYFNLFGHSFGAAMFNVSAGAQIRDVGAIHGNFHFSKGFGEYDIGTQAYAGSVSWEFIFGRVRPGLGLMLHHLVFDGRVNDVEQTGPGLRAFVTVDILQSPHANMCVGLDGELARLREAEDAYPGLGFSLGGRFKTP